MPRFRFELILTSVLVALATCFQAQNAQPAATAPLEMRFDPALAREQGWVAADDSAEQVHEALLGFVRWRLTVAGIEHELVPSASGALVRTPENDAHARARARGILTALGPCEFYVIAEAGDFPAEFERESALCEEWREEHPGRPLLEYNADPSRPLPAIAWLPRRFGEEQGPPLPVLLPRSATDAFGARDFGRVFPTIGNLDYPAIGFELSDARVEDFGSFTGRFVKRRLAIVLLSHIRSAPTLISRLVGKAIIEGKFSDTEVKNLITRIRSGDAGPVTLVE